MLYVHTAGAKEQPAIVFIHGAGLSGRMWEPQLAQLADRFYCLAPDLPAHGRSDWGVPFELTEAVQRLAETLDRQLDGRRAHVVGLSLGGAVALELARQAPQLVERVLVSGTARLVMPFSLVARINAVALGYLGTEGLLDIVSLYYNLPADYRPMLNAELRPRLSGHFFVPIVDALSQWYPPAQADLLVVLGERELPLLGLMAALLTMQIEGAELAIARGLGHIWNLEDPALFGALVHNWACRKPLPEAVYRLCPREWFQQPAVNPDKPQSRLLEPAQADGPPV